MLLWHDTTIATLTSHDWATNAGMWCSDLTRSQLLWFHMSDHPSLHPKVMTLHVHSYTDFTYQHNQSPHAMLNLTLTSHDSPTNPHMSCYEPTCSQHLHMAAYPILASHDMTLQVNSHTDFTQLTNHTWYAHTWAMLTWLTTQMHNLTYTTSDCPDLPNSDLNSSLSWRTVVCPDQLWRVPACLNVTWVEKHKKI